jgi:O-acetyl-ADP-ribose deacetylase (regulator of RNase III)
MSISIVHGNIFNTKLQTVVNTVNCVGVMGKGIALLFKLRYPHMFDLYTDHCKKGSISIGKLWIYKGEKDAPWVLNFPTKFHWKYPSKMEYLEKGLEKFCETYKEQGVTSIAFPLLGAFNGGLDKDEVLMVMTSYLSKCDIPIEIYEYDPDAPDDLFEKFCLNWKALSLQKIKEHTSISKDKIATISTTIESGKVRSMIGLINERGIGLKTMDKCFRFVLNLQGQLQSELDFPEN